jgi:hypothetical protein
MNQYSCLRVESKKLLQTGPKNAAIWPHARSDAVPMFAVTAKTFRQSPWDILRFHRELRTFSNKGTRPVFLGKPRQQTLWRLDAAGVFDLDQGQNFDKQF